MVTFELLEIPAPGGTTVVAVEGAFRCDRSQPLPRIVGAVGFVGRDPGRIIDAKILHAYIPSGPFVAEMPEFAAKVGQAAWARLPLYLPSIVAGVTMHPVHVAGEPTFVDAPPSAPG